MEKRKLFKARIFPSITTISGTWSQKIKEIKRLKLKEVCLFLTFVNYEERKNIYDLLKKTKIKNIPLVHLRSDIKPEELEYLLQKYKIRAFALHSLREYPLIYDYSKYRKIIFIENVFEKFDKNELEYFGGVCLDLSHLENDRILHKRKFQNTINFLKEYTIGCNHVSAMKKVVRFDREENALRYDSHYFKKLSEFDYLKTYPKSYFSEIIAIELENNIKEQLAAKKYIEKVIGD